LLGLNPGKLAALNGVQVLKDNFGVAVMDDKSLAPQQRFVVIPHISVWRRVRELTKANGGKKPFILRKGHVVEFERNGETIRLRIQTLRNDPPAPLRRRTQTTRHEF